MDTQFPILGSALVAETLGEHISIWCIRGALAILAICFGAELSGVSPIHKTLAGGWFLGALLATGHSLGSLWTFHHGSQAEALASTASQTKELLGFAFSAGLYFNYLFVAAWLLDSLWRLAFPQHYLMAPQWPRRAILAFLLFIAWNGTVVFKGGIIRWLGIIATVAIFAIWYRTRPNKWRHTKSPVPQ